MPPLPLRYAALVALAALALTGCASDQSASPDTPAQSGTPDPSPTSAATPGGTAADPVALTAGTRLLDWQPVPGPVEDTVTLGGGWSLSVNEAGTEARLRGGSGSATVTTSEREGIADAFLDGDHAVVVKQDRQESRPAAAVIVDLDRPADLRTVDGSSAVPTTTGGTWALGQGHLLHATIHDGAYCAASLELASGTSTRGWCAPKRHGFNSARITPAGDSLLTFDDARPACRTVVALDGETITPFPGVPDCRAWDGLLLDGGAVWSVIANEKQIEEAHLYARTGTEYFDLGPGTSGTLTWCAGAAYFVRDPQRDGDPARLLRWAPSQELETVYESQGGQGFLTAPRCGGDTITLTALTDAGDEQVSAALG